MPLTKEITVDRNKKIFVFDDVFEMDWRRHAFKFIRDSRFCIGWADQEDPHNAEHVYMHSRWDQKDIQNFGIFNQIKEDKILELLKGKTLDLNHGAIINCSYPTDTYFAHSHKNTTVLYYANVQWKEEWAGETLFFNEDVSEIEFASMYKPGRLIVFDGGIPHSLRPQSKYAPQYRFTATFFFDPGRGLTETL
jgi:hypothetical protein